MYRIAEPVMKWHKANEGYLLNRQWRASDWFGPKGARTSMVATMPPIWLTRPTKASRKR
jgi:hypothetical protein